MPHLTVGHDCRPLDRYQAIYSFPLDDHVRGSEREPGLALGGTIVRQGPCTVAIPVTAQKPEKIHLARMENLLRSLHMLARHQPATEFKQQAAGRPERRYHTGFTRFSQGKALLHLVHEPPEQRPSPARQLFDLGPGRDAHLTCRLAWVAIVRGVEHAAHLVEDVARVIAPAWIDDISFIHGTMAKISKKSCEFMPERRMRG